VLLLTHKKGLSGNALKIIAIIAMTVDHVAWLVFSFMGKTPFRFDFFVFYLLKSPSAAVHFRREA